MRFIHLFIQSIQETWLSYTAKNSIISPNFLVWQFCGKAQFPQSFGRPKLCANCLSTKLPHQEIRWNYAIFRSDKVFLRIFSREKIAREKIVFAVFLLIKVKSSKEILSIWKSSYIFNIEVTIELNIWSYSWFLKAVHLLTELNMT